LVTETSALVAGEASLVTEAFGRYKPLISLYKKMAGWYSGRAALVKETSA
jgi:hypothetical protein